MQRTIFAVLATVAMAVLGVGCGGKPPGPKRIRLSLILGDTSEWYRGAVRWKELVETSTGGRYRIEVVTNASRSNNSQGMELQDVQAGRLEASLESTILLSTIDDRWAVFSFPWLFSGHDVANAVCDGPAGREMLDHLEERGLVGLAYGANGFRQITNNQRPIRTADDLKGLKIRIPQGLPPVLFEHFGASAHHMNFGDLIVALRTGAMHGQENPLSVINAAKLSSVQKHLTICNYVYDPIVLCVNKDFWEKLPEADRKILRKSAKQAFDSERDLVAKADKELPGKLAAAGMEITRLTDEQLTAFKARREGLRPEFERLVGADLLQSFEQACAAAEKK